jgi:hypothetical protein
MPNIIKGSAMFMITSRTSKKIFSIMLLSMLFFCLDWPSVIVADDHKRHQSDYKRYENRKDQFDYSNREEGQEKNADEGNEITGQTTAWLLVAANLTIAISILMKAMIRYFPLEPEIKRSIKKFNQLQKKHLMRFHYVLNPVALGMACFHFLLSSCRSSSMPEWGLIMVSLMVFLGFILKFQLSPKGTGRFVYRLHTTPAFIMIIVFLLVVGHQFVD